MEELVSKPGIHLKWITMERGYLGHYERKCYDNDKPDIERATGISIESTDWL